MKNFEKYKTAEERLVAFDRWHEKHCGMSGVCAKDDICAYAVLSWLEDEFVEEKPLPCPFCGGEVIVQTAPSTKHSDYAWVECVDDMCAYSSGTRLNRDKTIAAHNRVARAVQEIEKVG